MLRWKARERDKKMRQQEQHYVRTCCLLGINWNWIFGLGVDSSRATEQRNHRDTEIQNRDTSNPSSGSSNNHIGPHRKLSGPEEICA